MLEFTDDKNPDKHMELLNFPREFRLRIVARLQYDAGPLLSFSKVTFFYNLLNPFE